MKNIVIAALIAGISAQICLAAEPKMAPGAVAKLNSAYEEPKVKAGLDAAAPAVAESKVASRTGGKIVIGGSFNNEYTIAKNVVFLNNNLPDEVGYFRGTFDLEGDYTAGHERYGHDAIKLHSELRYRGYWGNIWAGQKSGWTEIQIADAKNEAKHEHAGEKPMPWMRQIWAAVSIDALARLENQGTHILKVGWFPFSFGRGIALGDSYGNNKNFLGVYNRPSDYAPAGILYSGRVYEGQLGYDVYFTQFEDRSVTVKDTMAQGKAHLLSATPNKAWNGHDNDDVLFGAQVTVIPSMSDDYGRAKIAPYFLYNAAKDKEIERTFDAENNLFTTGCMFDYNRGGFEIGGEFAFNLGTRKMHGIDRLRVIAKRRSDGIPYNVYEGIKRVNSDGSDTGVADDKYPVVTDTLKATLAANNQRTTEGTFTSGGYYYKNYTTAGGDSFNRIRHSQANPYKGWMLVADMAYAMSRPGLKFAVCGGWVSGDALPEEGSNREYKGFVGLNESYSGTRVKSAIFMDSRTVKRPLTFDETNKYAAFKNEDESFSDLRFAGFSATFIPEKFKHVSFMSNTLLFWKDHRTGKPTIDAGNGSVTSVSTTEFLDQFYGTESNLILHADILENLTLKIIGGAFFPGRYYFGIKGLGLKQAVTDALSIEDVQGIDNTQYGMGKDTAFFFRTGLTYRF